MSVSGGGGGAPDGPDAGTPPFGESPSGLGRGRRVGCSCELIACDAILSAAMFPAFWPYTRPAS
jgi:hypothetical protein